MVNGYSLAIRSLSGIGVLKIHTVQLESATQSEPVKKVVRVFSTMTPSAWTGLYGDDGIGTAGVMGVVTQSTISSVGVD